MYALVFDNTFAKSFAKSATFVLLTYPTGFPPQINHHMHHIQGSSTESMAACKDTSNARKVSLKRETSAHACRGKLTTQRSSDDWRDQHQG